MCGRYTDTRRDKEFLVRMGIAAANDIQLEFNPRYNIAPTQDAWVIARDNSAALAIKKARWGLIPGWAKDQKIGSSLINARCETLGSKPAFRTGFRKRRCLVLADGFFEWKKDLPNRGKQPYYFRMKEGGQFAMAGLWESWISPQGEKLESYCVVTVPANELIRPIHDRMPLILHDDGAHTWMKPDASPADIESLLKPFPAPKMDSYPVNPLVSTPRNEGEICIQRADVAYELVKKPTAMQGDLF